MFLSDGLTDHISSIVLDVISRMCIELTVAKVAHKLGFEPPKWRQLIFQLSKELLLYFG